VGSDTSVVDTDPVTVTGFSASLDGILSWLAEANGTLSSLSPVANDIESLKEQFHQHEVSVVLRCNLYGVMRVSVRLS